MEVQGQDLPVQSSARKEMGTEARQFANPELPGYLGFANLPNQVHRKSVKKGFEFTLMVVGESGLGKSTLIKSLFQTEIYADRILPTAEEKVTRTVKIEAKTVDIEERGVKLRLTVVDTPGFGDAINSENCYGPIVEYIDEQFEKYLQDESALNRRHIVDSRVHCCFYFISPIGHGLKPIDVAFMKAVHHKVNIVPVIAKSDTLVKSELMNLKKQVLQELEKNQIQIYTMPECDDDEDAEYKEQCSQLKEAVPFAVIGSESILEVRSRKIRGRQYPWGVVEIENPDQCDFVKLRMMLITHMQDLQEVTQEIHYENFRSEKMASGGVTRKINRARNTTSDVYERDEMLTEKERQLCEKEAELKKMQDMISKMQAEMQKQANAAQPAEHVNGAPSSEES